MIHNRDNDSVRFIIINLKIPHEKSLPCILDIRHGRNIAWDFNFHQCYEHRFSLPGECAPMSAGAWSNHHADHCTKSLLCALGKQKSLWPQIALFIKQSPLCPSHPIVSSSCLYSIPLGLRLFFSNRFSRPNPDQKNTKIGPKTWLFTKTLWANSAFITAVQKERLLIPIKNLYSENMYKNLYSDNTCTQKSLFWQ